MITIIWFSNQRRAMALPWQRAPVAEATSITENDVR